MACLGGLGGLLGYGSLAGLAAQQQGLGRLYEDQARQMQNPFRGANPEREARKKELSIKEELQADTDKWLADIKF